MIRVHSRITRWSITTGILALSLSLASAGMSGDAEIALKQVGDDFLSRIGAKPTKCLQFPTIARKILHTACGEFTVTVKEMQDLILGEMRRRDWSVEEGWGTESLLGERFLVSYAAHDGHVVTLRIAGKDPALLHMTWEEEWPPADKDAVRPIYMTEEVTPPERWFFVQPKYPEDARKAGREGRSILEIVVNKKGVVKDLRILESNYLFDEAAMKAVRKWKYKPALKEGRPVAVFITIIVEFNL